MNLEYTAVEYRPDDATSYNALMPTKGAPLLSWRYVEHPSGTTGIMGQATKASELVGMTPFLPISFKGGLRGYQAIDTFVSEKARGKGAFLKMADEAMKMACERHADCVFGFPNGAAARGWFTHLGWTQLGVVPYLARPTHSGFLFKQLFGRDIVRFPLRYPRRAAIVEPVDKFGDWSDRVWVDFSRTLPCSVDRTQSFLRWRLHEHPTEQYKTVGWRDSEGNLSAFVSTQVVQKHGGSIGYIMEAIASRNSLNVLPGVIEAAIMGMGDVDIVLAWCFPHAPNYRSLRQSGFWPIPNRLRPFELNFGARAFTPAGRLFLSAKHWYLSYLDADTV